jgi:hypothetical protein
VISSGGNGGDIIYATNLFGCINVAIRCSSFSVAQLTVIVRAHCPQCAAFHKQTKIPTAGNLRHGRRVGLAYRRQHRSDDQKKSREISTDPKMVG